MKKKFLLCVGSVMCLSLSAIQISNAVRPDSDCSASSSSHYISTVAGFKNFLTMVGPVYVVDIQDPSTGEVRECVVCPQDGDIKIYKKITKDLYNRIITAEGILKQDLGIFSDLK